ncbi:hypothetical protein ACWD0J_21715 [Streptomyces sp. NPDC003011]
MPFLLAVTVTVTTAPNPVARRLIDRADWLLRRYAGRRAELEGGGVDGRGRTAAGAARPRTPPPG